MFICLFIEVVDEIGCSKTEENRRAMIAADITKHLPNVNISVDRRISRIMAELLLNLSSTSKHFEIIHLYLLLTSTIDDPKLATRLARPHTIKLLKQMAREPIEPQFGEEHTAAAAKTALENLAPYIQAKESIPQPKVEAKEGTLWPTQRIPLLSLTSSLGFQNFKSLFSPQIDLKELPDLSRVGFASVYAVFFTSIRHIVQLSRFSSKYPEIYDEMTRPRRTNMVGGMYMPIMKSTFKAALGAPVLFMIMYGCLRLGEIDTWVPSSEQIPSGLSSMLNAFSTALFMPLACFVLGVTPYSLLPAFINILMMRKPDILHPHNIALLQNVTEL